MGHLLIENFDEKLHEQIKIQAVKNKITLREAVAEAIKEWVKKHK